MFVGVDLQFVFFVVEYDGQCDVFVGFFVQWCGVGVGLDFGGLGWVVGEVFGVDVVGWDVGFD